MPPFSPLPVSGLIGRRPSHLFPLRARDLDGWRIMSVYSLLLDGVDFC